MVPVRNQSQIPIIGRLVWMMAGPALLLLCTVQILYARADSWFKVADALYWFVLAAMLLGRWVEHRGGNPRNGMGEPATVADFRRYVVITATLGAAIWVATNFLRIYWQQ